MSKFREMNVPGYESVLQSVSEYDVTIAVHSTKLGPALGGCRLMHYQSPSAALTDVLRLAEGMTYKNSLAGLKFGGGKAVINLHPGQDRQKALEVFAGLINVLDGSYITAEDVGTHIEDITYVNTLSPHTESLDNPVDPSHMTALGVYRAMEATAKFHMAANNLSNFKVSVLGLGKVGFELCRILHGMGAKLTVADINEARTKMAQEQFRASVVDCTELHRVPTDIFAPCALGGLLCNSLFQDMNFSSIVGSANNQLFTSSDGQYLYDKRIHYAPDFLVNAGGVITVASQIDRPGDIQYTTDQVSKIYDTMMDVYNISQKDQLPTHIVAENLAKARLK